MSKPKVPSYQLLFFYVLTLIVFSLINFQFEEPENHTILYWSYGLNGVVTVLYILIVTFLSKSLKNQIGFLFLGFATFKIILFLIVQFITEFEIKDSHYFILFVPYFVSLIFEILLTKKILDNISFEK